MISADSSLVPTDPLNPAVAVINQPPTTPSAAAANQKKVDKSSILRSTIDFLKFHSEPKASKNIRYDISGKTSSASSVKSFSDDTSNNSQFPSITSEFSGLPSGPDGSGSTKRRHHQRYQERTDAWKPSSLSYEEFAQLMLEVSRMMENPRDHNSFAHTCTQTSSLRKLLILNF